MKFYKIIVAYDGTDYQGWQEQKEYKSIIGKLKESFIEAFNQELSIVGASRTDAGVHALGQVALVRTNLSLDPETIMNVWNNRLPFNILIKSCQSVDNTFHPMKNVLQKTYFYDFSLERPSPFNARYAWYFRWHIDLIKLNNCLQLFKGTHDFRSFCTGYEMQSTIRTIDSIELKKIPELNCFRIEIKGKSFLSHMIRRIVGASLEVSARKNLEINYLNNVLEQKNPKQLLPNASSRGLMLYNITYKP